MPDAQFSILPKAKCGSTGHIGCHADKPKWYVLRCVTGREAEVAKRVRQIPGIESAIAPRRTLMERRHGRWRDVVRITFPGYVFLAADLTAETYYKVSEIPYVIRFLKSDDRPQPVPENQMALVLALDNGGQPFGLSNARIVGGRYRIISGPLVRLAACVKRIDARRGRATIEIPLLGEARQIDLGIKASNPDIAQADSSPCEMTGEQAKPT